MLRLTRNEYLGFLMEYQYDFEHDQLRISLPLPSTCLDVSDRDLPQITLPGLLDIGPQGRLLTLEFALPTSTGYGMLLQPYSTGGIVSLILHPDALSERHFVRSHPVHITLTWDNASRVLTLTLPRRTASSELLYPSGPS